MKIYREKAIILRAFDFKEKDRILTLLSERLGIVKVIAKGVNCPRKHNQMAYSPLSEVEVVFQCKDGEDLGKLREISLLTAFRKLRRSYQTLAYACKLLDIVYKTQMQGKPLPMLYRLLSLSLKKMEILESYPIYLCFLVKLLKHEGLLAEQLVCNVCFQSLEDYFFFGGELFCGEHAPGAAKQLEKDSQMLFQILLRERSLDKLGTLNLSSEEGEGIEEIFQDTISSQTNYRLNK